MLWTFVLGVLAAGSWTWSYITRFSIGSELRTFCVLRRGVDHVSSWHGVVGDGYPCAVVVIASSLIGIDAMCAALDAFLKFISDSPCDARVLQILYCGAGSPKSEYRETSANIHQHQLDDVTAWVQAGIDDGSIRAEGEPKSVAAQYIAYISGMTYLWLINPSSIDFRKANDDMKVHLRMSMTTE